LALTVLAGGCSGDIFGRSDAPTVPGAARSSPSLGDRISSLFGSPPQEPQAEATTPAPRFREDFDCPTVAIRPGTSTFAVSAPGLESAALAVRYQATFGQMARECRLVGNTLSMKVGVEGRVILGPAGGPGQLEIPLRFAVVREGPEPQTIITKLRWLSVTIPPDAGNVPFTHVEEELSFPMPRGREIEAYVVYVGFDREAVKEPQKKRPAKPPQRPPRRDSGLIPQPPGKLPPA
jgi:hypothetical protein